MSGATTTPLGAVGSAGRVTVTHFGDRADGEGGIAAVVRSHLRDSPASCQARAVTSYDQQASSFLGRQRPLAAAVIAAVRLPRHASVAHVHLSRRASLVREGLLLALLHLRGVPVVATLHGSTAASMDGAQLAAVRSLLRAADRVHGFDDRYRARFRVPPSRWVALPNGVRIPPTISPKEAAVVFAGRVGHRKGADLLAAAWYDMPSGAELRVYGALEDGPRPSGPGVSLHGGVSHEVVLAAIERAAILVLPSRAEAFPVAVCEGLAAGCAVVGTDVGALGTMLRSAGQVVVPLDAGAIRAALLDLLTSPDRAAALGAAGRAWATEHLDSRAVAAAWATVYAEVASGRGRRARTSTGSRRPRRSEPTPSPTGRPA